MDGIDFTNEQDEMEPEPETPEAIIEMMYIQEFLQERGHRLQDLCDLPYEEAKKLMKEACAYASYRLAEVKSRANLRRNLGGKKRI